MADWLPFGFSLILWFTGSPAMATIWILSVGLGVLPTTDIPAAMMGVSILAVVRATMAKANRGQL